MDSLNASLLPDDLSALAWVHDEIRKSLDAAHKSLHRILKAAQSPASGDADALDPTLIRSVRQQVHQGIGALELAGLPAGALLLRASEALLQKHSNRPQHLTPEVVQAIEAASFALLDLMRRRLAGKHVAGMALYPQYERLTQLAGSVLARPSDLWVQEWQAVSLDTAVAWPEPGPGGVTPQAIDARAVSTFESALLSLLRGGRAHDARALVSLCSGLAVGAAERHAHREASTWTLAAGFLEAVAEGRLPQSVHVKRVLSALLGQLRTLARNPGLPSDRLAQELLFFCAQAEPPRIGAPQGILDRLRSAFRLEQQAPVDLLESPLGRFDPLWVTQALKRVSSAKDAWSAVAGGDLARLPQLPEQFNHVADSLQRLYPGGAVLAQALSQAAGVTAHSGTAPPAALAMEVATALLYLDASLDEAEFEKDHERERVNVLAQRIQSARQGGQAQPLEAWMEGLYRQVSDRQTIGSVVQELRGSLAECEKRIDQFFRDPAQSTSLLEVPSQLQSMKGVLSVLGLDSAAQAITRMRQDVESLLAPDADLQQAAQAGVHDRLASNLGALGFLVDMLAVQPPLAKSLFVLNEESGVLSPIMGRAVAPERQDVDPIEVMARPAQQEDLAQSQQMAEALRDSAALPGVSLGELGSGLQALAEHAAVADQPGLVESIAQARAALDHVQGSDDALALSDARDQVVSALNDFAQPTSDPVEWAHGPGLTGAVGAGSGAGSEAGAGWAGLGLPSLDLPSLLMPEAVPPGTEPGARPPVATGLEDDDEMRGIFLEEAREVVASAREAVVGLADAPSEPALLTTVRRAFHTLKGSARMVGLTPFGEAAWACEQLYNTWLAGQAPASHDLLDFTAEALDHLSAWVDDIAARQDTVRSPDALVAAAEAMRLDNRRVSWQEAGEEGRETAPSQALDLMTLDLGDVSPDVPVVEAVEPALQPEPEPESLSGLVPTLDGARLEDLTLRERTLEEPTLEDPTLEEPTLEEGTGSSPREDEQVKVIGDLRIGIALFNIYLNEADEQSRRLCTALSEWALELHRPVGEATVALAHSLAGNSGTVGYADLSRLARALEHALERSHALGHGDEATAALFGEAADEVRRLLHQFAAGFLKSPPAALLERLEQLDLQPAAVGAAPRGHLRLVRPDLADTDTDTDTGAPLPLQAVAGGLGGSLPEVAPVRRFDTLPQEHLITRSVTGEGDVDLGEDSDIDAADAIDIDLFPIFEEEAQELLPQLAQEVSEWLRHPGQRERGLACMRTLHTFKGGARLAGAMRLGELAHRMESAVERVLGREPLSAEDLLPLQARSDILAEVLASLQRLDLRAQQEELDRVVQASLEAVRSAGPATPLPEPGAQRSPEATTEATTDVGVDLPPDWLTDLPESLAQALVDTERETEGESVGDAARPASEAPGAAGRAAVVSRIDWGTVRGGFRRGQATGQQDPASASAMVRVKPRLLDRLVNQAGEVSIARSRLATQMQQMRSSVGDLTDNLERLRLQLRDIELQAETQMGSRLEAARAAQQSFDPLEFDRYTRFQELTRMMAESVNDVATVQRGLIRNLETADDQLAAQFRLTRDLQDDLLRTRMVEFDGLSDRLYRVVRQAAKETGKQVRLDLAGGQAEVDRGVLDRMSGAFEHLLRNCVTHGVEPPGVRTQAGKDAMGTILVAVRQEGNEISIEFRDDGAGLDLARIRSKAEGMGLLPPDARVSEAELAQLIFTPGFSTAESVSELAGRGIGMDVVRADVNAMGGRIETSTAVGQGTSFRLVLPLTTAVTKVVMVRCGPWVVSIPTHLVERVRRVQAPDLQAAYESGTLASGDQSLPFFWLGALLHSTPRGSVEGRTLPVVIVRSAQQRVALHVDEVLGNQDAVVKNLGPQLSRVPGLAGMTLLASGSVALIYNPVALAAVHGAQAQEWTRKSLQGTGGGVADFSPLAAVAQAPQAPLVLVVDDSLTVRRVTQRLLVREGYRVTLAKDGLDALEKMAEETPVVVLSDIEMPRMDGFDLARNLRNDERWRSVPIVMITSRIAQKHRDYAMELGVNHYLGKPYSEEELVGLVATHARAAEPGQGVQRADFTTA